MMRDSLISLGKSTSLVGPAGAFMQKLMGWLIG